MCWAVATKANPKGSALTKPLIESAVEPGDVLLLRHVSAVVLRVPVVVHLLHHLLQHAPVGLQQPANSTAGYRSLTLSQSQRPCRCKKTGL